MRHKSAPSTLPHRFIETLLDNLPGMAYRCANDQPWTMTFVSGGCATLTGYTPETASDNRLRWAELVHAADRETAKAAVNTALAAGQQFDIQYRIIDKFGRERWVREQGCGVYSDSGIVESIEGYIDDITPLRSAVLALATSESFYEEEVRQKHERLSVTFENAPMGIVTYRWNGPFLSANRAFCEMTMYTLKELHEMTVMDLTHPDDRNESVNSMARIQRGEIETFSQRKRYLRKDGEAIDVNVVTAVTHDAAGRPNVIIGQVENLTEQIKALAEIRRQHEQLAHADRLHTLGEMATGIAHEINQPLTAISLFAHTGKRLIESGDYTKLHEVFDKLSQHSRRAGAIIERMQDLARRKKSAKELINLNSLVEGIVDLAEIDAQTNEIVIELDLEAHLPRVEVDVVQIQQVTLNLLRNGIDAIRSTDRRNGSTIRLITRNRADGFLEVAVEDCGSGVSENIAEGLFDLFSTSKSTGLGMGLPISKAIIAEHGGQLKFRNNTQSGATFSFTLPAAKGEKHG